LYYISSTYCIQDFESSTFILGVSHIFRFSLTQSTYCHQSRRFDGIVQQEVQVPQAQGLMDSTNEHDTFRLSQEQIRSRWCSRAGPCIDAVTTRCRPSRTLSETLAQHGVDTDHLHNTGGALHNLSSTNGSGRVLELFYDDWKMKVATNPRMFIMTTQLWESAYCHCGETKEDLRDEDNNQFKWHPADVMSI
jgi:hypothetical protein